MNVILFDSYGDSYGVFGNDHIAYDYALKAGLVGFYTEPTFMPVNDGNDPENWNDPDFPFD
jgi:hypothetical protein